MDHRRTGSKWLVFCFQRFSAAAAFPLINVCNITTENILYTSWLDKPKLSRPLALLFERMKSEVPNTFYEDTDDSCSLLLTLVKWFLHLWT